MRMLRLSRDLHSSAAPPFHFESNTSASMSTTTDTILAGVELVNAKGETADGAVVTRDKLLAFYFAVRGQISSMIILPSMCVDRVMVTHV